MGRLFTRDDELALLPALEPGSQAEMLTRLAQDARLVRMALAEQAAGRSDVDRLATSFQRALGDAMDAEAQDETERARLQLAATLADARSAGLTLSAMMDEVEFDGVLGMQRLPVLTAVLSAH
jgi:hypothetical protein